eukprot:42525-Hanusia_phi.AAC.1
MEEGRSRSRGRGRGRGRGRSSKQSSRQVGGQDERKGRERKKVGGKWGNERGKGRARRGGLEAQKPVELPTPSSLPAPRSRTRQ